MSGITNFVSDKSREENVLEHFEKLCQKAKTKRDIREIEMHVLKPEPIPRYQGKQARGPLLKRRSLLLVFNNKDIIYTLSKMFRVSTYTQNNTNDVEFIVELVKLLENGRLIWDKKKNKYYLNMRNGRKLRI